MASREPISLRKIVTTDMNIDDDGVKLGDVVVTSDLDSPGHGQDPDISGILSPSDSQAVTNDRYPNPPTSEFNDTIHSHTTAQSGGRKTDNEDDDEDSSDESSDRSSYLSSIEQMKKENYRNFLEVKFMRAVRDNDYMMVESMLWKQKHEVHVDSLDEVGYTSLAVACLSNSSEMMAVLLKYGCKVREELLVCIDQDFREGAVTLLERLYNLQGSFCVNQPPMEKMELFPAGATAVKVASVANNLEMLKLLRRYGAEPIPIPDQEVTAKNSTEVYYTMKALASPAYCLVMAKKDPMMTAFKVSTHCRQLAEQNPHQSDQYEELSNKMEAFAHQWFGNASDNYEVNMIIGLPDQTTMEPGSANIVLGSKPNASAGFLESNKYCRLRYALLHNHVSFVSHPYCQQAVLKDFEACLPSGWRDKPTAFKVCVIFALTMLTPIWIGLYWLLPDKEYPMRKFGNLLHWPYMKVMTNLLLYAIIQVALIMSKNKWDMVSFDPGEPGETRARLLASTGNTNSRYIPNVDFLSIYICIWTVGNLWSEGRKIFKFGFGYYNREATNVTCLIMTLLFFISTLCNLILWNTEYASLDIEEIRARGGYPQWIIDMGSVHEVTITIGNLFLFQRLSYWISLSSYMGKTFYYFTVPLKAIFKFFVLFVFFFIAFAVSLNGLLWPSYANLLQFCRESNLGSIRQSAPNLPPSEGGTAPANASSLEDQLAEEFELECRNLLADNEFFITDRQFIRDMISFVGVGFELIFAMFGADPRSRLLSNFRAYSTPQEATAAMLYAAYAFFQILVRLNVLIALIVAALTQIYQRANEEYKFYRTKVMMAFIDPEDATWIPSPLNLIPTIRNVQHYIVKKAKEKKKYTTSTALREQMNKEAMEQIRKEKSAIGKMVDNVSRRTLRLTAKEKVDKKITVDHLNDLKASLSPVFIQSKNSMSQLDENMRDFISARFLVSKRALERRGENF